MHADTCSSEEVGLLHDPEELLLIHHAIAVAICLLDHLLQLFCRHALTELLGHALQILQCNSTCLVIVKEAESLQDLVLRVSIKDLVRQADVLARITRSTLFWLPLNEA